MKYLREVATKGVKASTRAPGSTGTDPGVDYAPKAPDDQKFVKKHETEKHLDRAGNGPDVYCGDDVKHSLDDPKNARLAGKGKGAEKVSEETIEEDYHPDIQFHVHDKNGNLKGKYSSDRRARAGVDKHDNAYGGYAHHIKYFNKKTNQYVSHQDAYRLGEETEMAEEHEGFAKLKGKLSHEKGVSDPGALAASIGRKKYGEKGMEKKSEAGKTHKEDVELDERNQENKLKKNIQAVKAGARSGHFSSKVLSSKRDGDKRELLNKAKRAGRALTREELE